MANEQEVTVAAPDRRKGNGAAIASVAIGLLGGGIGGFLSLEVLFVGSALTIVLGVLLVLRAEGERWVTAGGFLVGMGAVGSILLSPALSNHDPAVTYAPSTIPALILSILIAVAGVLMLVTVAASRFRRDHRSIGPPDQHGRRTARRHLHR